MAKAVDIILVSAGSFNPITNLHLRMFEIARDQLQASGKYRVVGGIISPVSNAYAKHKPTLLTSEHRCAMVKLALAAHERMNRTLKRDIPDWIKLDTYEVDRPTAHTLTSDLLDYFSMSNLSERFGLTKKSPTPSLRLLCGSDLLASFAIPDCWSELHMENIASRHGIVVVSRAGFDPRMQVRALDVLARNAVNIDHVTEWVGNEVSSTAVRLAARRGEPLAYLVADEVAAYIEKNGLYKN